MEKIRFIFQSDVSSVTLMEIHLAKPDLCLLLEIKHKQPPPPILSSQRSFLAHWLCTEIVQHSQFRRAVITC